MNNRTPQDLASDVESAVAEARLDKEELRIRAAYQRRSPAQDARDYSYFKEAILLKVHAMEREMLRGLRRAGVHSLATSRILEVGCGRGLWLRQLVQWGAEPENLVGIDLLPEPIAEARHLCAPGVQLHCGSAAHLPFPAETFDIAIQLTVFSSILDGDARLQVAREMLRVLKPHGLILWYDFHMNNPRNPDVCGIKRREIERLFPSCRKDLRRITLAPPLARRLVPYCPSLYPVLAKVPLLCTHYVGTIRKE